MVVLFGWKQRPFWRVQGLSAQLEAFLELDVGPHHQTAVFPSPQVYPCRTKPGRMDMSGPTRMLKFIGMARQNVKPFP